VDLLLDENNDLIFQNGECPVTTSDFNVVAQRLKIRLQTFLGEYKYDINYGVPYLQRILGYKVRKSEIDDIMRQAILDEEGVVEILEFISVIPLNTYNLSFTVINDKSLITPVINITVGI